MSISRCIGNDTENVPDICCVQDAEKPGRFRTDMLRHSVVTQFEKQSISVDSYADFRLAIADFGLRINLKLKNRLFKKD